MFRTILSSLILLTKFCYSCEYAEVHDYIEESLLECYEERWVIKKLDKEYLKGRIDSYEDLLNYMERNN